MKLLIEFYISICILLLIFNIIFILKKNIETIYFANNSNHFKRYIFKIYDRYNPDDGIDRKTEKKLERKLSKVKYLVTLCETLKIMTPMDEKFEQEIKICVWGQIDKYLRKNNEEQAYFAYVMSTFNYDKVKESEDRLIKFMEFLKTDSLYTFTNTMNAIYKFGNPYMVNLAIEKINVSNIFYHKKLLTKGLIDFKGDRKELNKILMANFKEYNNLIKEAILDYLRLDESGASEFCMNILIEDKEDNEIIYAAMRYLGKYPIQESKVLFQDILISESHDWIREMLAIKGLMSFKDRITKEIIYGKITHSDWYVRSNAVKYFVANFETERELKSILELNDKYTNECLAYQYNQINEDAQSVG